MKKTIIKISLAATIFSAAFAFAPKADSAKDLAYDDQPITTQSKQDPGTGGRG